MRRRLCVYVGCVCVNGHMWMCQFCLVLFPPQNDEGAESKVAQQAIANSQQSAGEMAEGIAVERDDDEIQGTHLCSLRG